MRGLDDMIEEIHSRQFYLANPRITVKRPPWWRPFSRRKFDRAVEGLRAFYRANPTGVMMIKPPRPPASA